MCLSSFLLGVRIIFFCFRKGNGVRKPSAIKVGCTRAARGLQVAYLLEQTCDVFRFAAQERGH